MELEARALEVLDRVGLAILGVLLLELLRDREAELPEATVIVPVFLEAVGEPVACFIEKDSILAVGWLVVGEPLECGFVASIFGEPIAKQRSLNLPLRPRMLRPMLQACPFEILDEPPILPDRLGDRIANDHQARRAPCGQQFVGHVVARLGEVRLRRHPVGIHRDVDNGIGSSRRRWLDDSGSDTERDNCDQREPSPPCQSDPQVACQIFSSLLNADVHVISPRTKTNTWRTGPR